MFFKFTNLLRLSFFLVFLGLVFTACDTDDPERRAERDRQKILDYLAENELEGTELESGVFIVIRKEGSGNFPHAQSTVRLSYTGYLLDDEPFDFRTSANLYLPSQLPGFRIGLMEFQRGSEGLILIPSGLAYGEYGTIGVPRNAVLIFEVEIMDFN